MKHFIKITILILFFLSCKNDRNADATISNHKKEDGKKIIRSQSNKTNLNVSVLLDLSDRINPEKYPNPSMEFYERDLGYINSITNSFETHLRNKRNIKIDDHIQLYIDPEPSDNTLNNKINDLNISFTRENAYKELIIKTSEKYDSISRLIYESAIKDNKYIGSDIWGFFKTKVKDFCIRENYRNILIILTDGYIYHKNTKRREGNLTSYIRPQDLRDFKLNTSSWEERITINKYGFIPVYEKLNSLEILVLGINPDKKNSYEEDVIHKYWSDWFNTMQVKRFEIKSTNLPANMDAIIKNFIRN